MLFTVRVEAKEDFPAPWPPKTNSPELPWSAQLKKPGPACWGLILGVGLAPRGADPGLSKGVALNQGRSMATGLRARRAILNIRSEGQERP